MLNEMTSGDAGPCSVYIHSVNMHTLGKFKIRGREYGDQKRTSNVSMTRIPVAAPPKAWVCGRLLARIAGSNNAGGMDVCLL
jgi:hypothetical protein